MSRRTIMATLKAGQGVGTITSLHSWGGGHPKISHIGTGTLLGAQSRVYANGSSGAAGSVLINKIAAISSTSTKYTTIECTATYGVDPPTQASGNRGSSSSDASMLIISNFSLFIDWDQGTVVYQGKYTFPGGSAAGYTGWQFYNGELCYLGGGRINNYVQGWTSDHMGRGPRSQASPRLTYNNNRHVTGVPVIDGPSHLIGYFSLHSYTITTDDGINVTAAPTPAPADPETPEIAPVVGVKISELNAVSSLQDDDLFVLSQDDASDGDYDRSLNVTLSDLKAGVAPDPIIHAKAYITVGGVVSNDSNIASVNVTAGGAGQYTYEINLTTPAVAGAIVSIAPQASTIAYDANADTEYKWVTTSQLRVFTFQSNNEGLSVIVLA